MGYISRDIAIIDEPAIVALSSLPNFIQFRPKPVAGRVQLSLAIKIQENPPAEKSKIIINTPDGATYIFKGTKSTEDVGGNFYYVSGQSSDTVENFRQSLLSNAWIAANFDISIPFVWQSGVSYNGDTLYITSKGYGSAYNITISTPDDASSEFYAITWINATSQNNDTISGENSTAEIELDIYINPRVFLGTPDIPNTTERLGTYAFSLQKTYVSQNPVWFNLSASFSTYSAKLPPVSNGWFAPNTVTVYRFTAKVKGLNSFCFYQSNALYAVHGYGPTEIDLKPYVYTDGQPVRLLTNKPRTTHYPGQKEFLNFIFSFDYDRNNGFDISVIGKVYTASGEYLGYTNLYTTIPVLLATINTCILDIEYYTKNFPNAGLVKVYLTRNGAVVSNALEYDILPECLHTLQSFSFINRLGGWDSVNFDASVKTEIKPQITTYDKTITPAYQDGNGVEVVYDNILSNTFTLKGAPVTNEVAEWLKEFAEARTVIDNDGRYVVIDDFTLVVSKDNDNMQIPTLKYHYSR